MTAAEGLNMPAPLVHVTVHDLFKSGDRVRLVRAEGREFVTESMLVVERDSTSVMFANVPSRAGYEVIVDRVQDGTCSVTLERPTATAASVQYRILQEDVSAITGWLVGPVPAAWSEWTDVGDGETLVFGEEVSVQMRAKP